MDVDGPMPEVGRVPSGDVDLKCNDLADLPKPFNERNISLPAAPSPGGALCFLFWVYFFFWYFC